jgi:hypothetical protein
MWLRKAMLRSPGLRPYKEYLRLRMTITFISVLFFSYPTLVDTVLSVRCYGVVLSPAPVQPLCTVMSFFLSTAKQVPHAQSVQVLAGLVKAAHGPRGCPCRVLYPCFCKSWL